MRRCTRLGHLRYKISIVPRNPKEVLMKETNRVDRPSQLQFFQPRRILPSWSSLPIDVRQTATRLIAQMLREHLMSQASILEERRTNNE